MIILLIMAYGIAAMLYGGKLVRMKYWRDLVLFGVLMLSSFLLFLIYLVGFRIPNPINALQHLYDILGLHY